MAKNTQRRKMAGFMRSVVAQNIDALLEYHHPKLTSKTARYHKLSEQTKLSVSSIQRIVGCHQGVSIDLIETIAYAFDLSPYHLLLPNLDPSNPQIVKGAVAGERALYARFMAQARKEKS